MADFEVTIHFDGGKKTIYYRFPNASDARTVHAKKDQKTKPQTILWKLAGDADVFEVDFPDNKSGNPFDPPTKQFKGDKGKPSCGTFNAVHNNKYSYAVTVFDKNGTKLGDDDPEIMFDLPLINAEAIPGVTIGSTADSAKDVLEKVFTELKNAADVKGDPTTRLFSPQGINLISVEVDPVPLKVVIKVAGPGVSS